MTYNSTRFVSLLRSFLQRRAAHADRQSAPQFTPTGHRAILHRLGETRRLITKDEALSLSKFVWEVSNDESIGASVIVTHTVTAVAMQHEGTGPRCIDSDELTVRWASILGTDIYARVTISTNVRDPEILRRVIQKGAPKRPIPPVPDDELEEEKQIRELFTPRSYTYMPVNLWHENTSSGIDTKRGEMLARLLTPLRGTPFHGTGTVAATEHAFFRYNPETKTTTWGESTDGEISLTARSANGTAVGWSGETRRDWSLLDPEHVAKEATMRSARQQGAERVEPGRYTAIFSSTAVGQLLYQMAPFFNVERGGPFSIPGNAVGQADRRGQQLFDARITLTTDPADPEGGDFPFFQDGMGYPSGRVTWFDKGVLKRRSVDFLTGMQYGMTPLCDPYCVRMSGGPTSVEEMIAQCERGIYVHRFSNIDVADSLSGTMNGFTRDGCLLIMDGKIKKPIKDFRFYESPFLAFNRVIALGIPERVAFGFGSMMPRYEPLSWPYAPIIAPPIMVRDFNFSALADAV